jgi:hypothetical protein
MERAQHLTIERPMFPPRGAAIIAFPGKAGPMPGDDLADTIKGMTPREKEEFAQRIRLSANGNAKLLEFADAVDAVDSPVPPARPRHIRDREDVTERVGDHREAVTAYSRAVAWEAAAESQNLPPAQVEEARQRTAEAFNKMQDCARMLFIIAPTDLRALVDLLMYLEKNFSTLPATVSHSGSSEQSIAFSLLRTMRLSLRAVAKYGKYGPE